MDDDHGYRIERVIEGDSVAEVLSYVQYDKQELIRRMRRRLEQAVRTGNVNMKESALMMRRYEEGLAAYTYLVDDDAEIGRDDGGSDAARNNKPSSADSVGGTMSAASSSADGTV